MDGRICDSVRIRLKFRPAMSEAKFGCGRVNQPALRSPELVEEANVFERGDGSARCSFVLNS